MSLGPTACSYAAIILHDDDIPVTSDKIVALLKRANVEVESYWPSLFAKFAEKRSIGELIANAGGGGAPVAVVAAPAAAAGGGGGAAAAPAAEEKKEEPQEESDDDMGFSLFD
ncbi:60S acidic ribosomal protein P1-like [Abrus precatorius]|uniref:60S acidic ribosomal protein P1-like n=1 Tax=Abrus precatorius TaxID=3816 RepID=A0A8B8KYH0_ABRPR|nr:60S acidic ribosomal protein P1-like [Abrus precatorius]